MHRIWGIDELVLSILEHCSDASRSSLGRTCKRLFAISCDVLWARPPNLEVVCQLLSPAPGHRFGWLSHLYAFLSFLPLFTRIMSGVYSFVLWTNTYAMISHHPLISHSRSIVQTNLLESNQEERQLRPSFSNHSNLSRFLFYAGRIKTLMIKERNRDAARIRALTAALDGVPLPLIFSRLQRLDIDISTVGCALEAVKFALPRVSFVRLTLAPPSLGTSDPILTEDDYDLQPTYANFLRPILQLHRLDRLHLFGKDPTPDAEQHLLAAVSSTFPSFREFEALMPVKLDGASLAVLGNMGRLQLLNIHLDGTPGNSSTMPFPSLSELNVTYASTEIFLQFLEIVVADHLTVLAANTSNSNHSSPNLVVHTSSKLSRTIARKWPSLQRFNLSGFTEYANTLDANAAEPRVPWHFKAFEDLLSCHDLVEIVVQTDIAVTVTDDDLLAIADSWTKLRTLVLITPEGRLGGTPQATFQGLLALARSCPVLRNIALPLTLQATEPFHITEAIDFRPNRSVVYLDVHGCPSCIPSTAINMLSQIFPHLRRFRFATRKYARSDALPFAAGEEDTRVQCMREIQDYFLKKSSNTGR